MTPRFRENYIPLKRAIRRDDRSFVRSVLTAHPELLHHPTPAGGWLHITAKAGAMQCSSLLLKLGVDIDGVHGSLLGAALTRACESGQLEVVRLLLGHGATMSTHEPDQNPFFAAILGGQEDVARELIAAGIDAGVSYTGDHMKDVTEEEFARANGQLGIAKLLQDHGKS